ncbi:membrane-associated progesterone receptor component 1-like protein, putative [Babesia ovata]|uniref:Membrane-associated progesterone receptor component 1-like protein, putative n=1 Tax=Babesia ovata TaxID=189622 RepID=A0A2H6KFQ4_9APIC|nr:membrane-associated progesterone receptor component 1-like protein, putative [Babesia ovata]GBE61825.1 membrane-associated progesterone receptor component 1-like protein, putative [Babesia ovata]
MASQRDEREMKAPAGGDKKRDLSKCVSTCPDKDDEDDRRTDKLKQMKEWKNRFDEFMTYTHTVLNDVLGDTRPDATSSL